MLPRFGTSRSPLTAATSPRPASILPPGSGRRPRAGPPAPRPPPPTVAAPLGLPPDPHPPAAAAAGPAALTTLGEGGGEKGPPPPLRHDDIVLNVSWSPDGRYLAAVKAPDWSRSSQ